MLNTVSVDKSRATVEPSLPGGSNRALLTDMIRTVQLWPVWVRLGIQDVRLRFRRSTLGVAWIFLNLAVMIGAVGLVYSHLLGQELHEFLPFLTVGVITWGYLTASIVEGGNAFISAEGYIKQIGLPIPIYVLRSFVSISVVMFLSLLAYFVVAVVYNVSFSLGALWAVPGLLLVGCVALLFVATFAYLNARFRDAVHLAGAVLQVLFYVTPVIWPPEALRDKGMPWVIDCNPFYHLLEVVRQPLLRSEPATAMNYLVVGGFILGLALVSWQCARHYHQRVVYFL
ncbi:MAG: ABC transporter permease [Deltaproteobacteria bacterium]|nr:ABC transporter permease [Deltaproteobacteria bacterium]